jgi:hypothetical protein
MAADQVTDGKTAPGVGKPQVFRSPIAILVWWVWVLFAVGNLVDLAVQGRDHASVVAAGILVLITGVAYVTAQRPRVIVSDDELTVRNPLRDHRIPWRNIARVNVADLLRIQIRAPGPARTLQDEPDKSGKGKVIMAWAVHYSRRRQYSAEVKARRAALRATPRRRMGGTSQFGIPQSRSTSYATNYAAPTQEAEALKIVRLLNDRATAAGIEQASEDGDIRYVGQPLLTSAWSWPAIAALLVPALLLLIICLI